MQEEKGAVHTPSRMKIYLALTLLLLALALTSFLIVPQGNSLVGCNRLLFASSRYTCLTGLALAQGNVSICAYAQGRYADACFLQVAEATNNSGACRFIQNASSEGSCASTIGIKMLNYSACQIASEPYSSRCLYAIGIRTSNETVCDMVGNITQRIACVSIINTKFAIRTGKAGFCANVTSSKDKTLTGIIINNLSVSTYFGSTPQSRFVSSSLYLLPNVTYTARDYCYSSIGAKYYNASMCNFVSAGQARSSCVLSSTAPTSTNATSNYTALLAACSQQPVYAQQCRDSVRLSQAINTKNATLCAQLSNIALVNACYTGLARAYANTTYCSNISNTTARNTCVNGT